MCFVSCGECDSTETFLRINQESGSLGRDEEMMRLGTDMYRGIRWLDTTSEGLCLARNERVSEMLFCFQSNGTACG